MANVKDDEFETLDFADEGSEIDSDARYEIAEMIADSFGRSVIDADLELAARIMAYVWPSADKLVGPAGSAHGAPDWRE